MIMKNKPRKQTHCRFCHSLLSSDHHTHMIEAVLNVQTDTHAARHVETQTNRLRTISDTRRQTDRWTNGQRHG